MAKHHQTTENKQKQKKRAKAKAVVAELARNQAASAGLIGLPEGLIRLYLKKNTAKNSAAYLC